MFRSTRIDKDTANAESVNKLVRITVSNVTLIDSHLYSVRWTEIHSLSIFSALFVDLIDFYHIRVYPISRLELI